MEPATPDAAELLENEAFVRRLAMRLASDPSDADDLAQETFLAALERTPRGSWRAWLARVLRNRAVSAMRHRDRREARERVRARDEAHPGTAELVERADLHRRIVTALLELPEPYRDVLLLRFLRGESVDEAARVLGISEATVRTRIRRGLSRLREHLGPGFLEENALDLTTLGLLGWAVRHTPEFLMKKSLVHAPVLVSGFVGASLGFGGSLLVQEGRENPPSPVLLEGLPALGGGAVAHESSGAERKPSLVVAEAVEREAVGSGRSSPELDPFVLLASPDRFDHLRALRILREADTQAALHMLLETFLRTDDGILKALVEEVLLETDQDLASYVLGAYESELDPEHLLRLTGIMRQLVARNPSLEPLVVDVLADSLRDPGPNGERLVGLRDALVDVGPAALDALADYLGDPLANPAGIDAAVEALQQLDAQEATAVRDHLEGIFGELLRASSDGALSPAERQAVVDRTSRVAWAAAHRPWDEHDELSAMFTGLLSGSSEVQQAQVLSWGLANLRGLSESRRVELTHTLIDDMSEQSNAELRQVRAWTVSQLATFYNSRPIDESFHQILRSVEEARSGAGSREGAEQLDWILNELRSHMHRKQD